MKGAFAMFTLQEPEMILVIGTPVVVTILAPTSEKIT